MVRWMFWIALGSLLLVEAAWGQCALCRAAAAQGGERFVRSLNAGILYLLAAPYLIVGVVAFSLYRAFGRGR